MIGALLLLLTGSPPAADCAGIPVRLSAAAVAQGSVVGVTVAGKGEVKATWNGRPLPFWREAPAAPWRALIGVDLEQSPGPAPLEVGDGGAPPCHVALLVTAGEFAVKDLKVARRFVEVSARDQARARREAARLDAIFRTVSTRVWEGAFRLPVDAPPSPNFGQRRILNGEPRSPHGGVDFGARAGAPVHAAGQGRVVLADTLFFSGRTVILDHGLGLFSFYGHLRSLAVREGQVVKAGGRLGQVGATGRATGPHLHWAVRLHGARVDPLALLAAIRE